jgi:hypothetical protein
VRIKRLKDKRDDYILMYSTKFAHVTYVYAIAFFFDSLDATFTRRSMLRRVRIVSGFSSPPVSR